MFIYLLYVYFLIVCLFSHCMFIYLLCVYLLIVCLFTYCLFIYLLYVYFLIVCLYTYCMFIYLFYVYLLIVFFYLFYVYLLVCLFTYCILFTYCMFIYLLCVYLLIRSVEGLLHMEAVQSIISLLPMACRTWALLSLLLCRKFPVQTRVWSLQRISKCLFSYGLLFNIKTIWISFTFRTRQSYWEFHMFILGPKVNFRYRFFVLFSSSPLRCTLPFDTCIK